LPRLRLIPLGEREDGATLRGEQGLVQWIRESKKNIREGRKEDITQRKLKRQPQHWDLREEKLKRDPFLTWGDSGSSHSMTERGSGVGKHRSGGKVMEREKV